MGRLFGGEDSPTLNKVTSIQRIQLESPDMDQKHIWQCKEGGFKLQEYGRGANSAK